MEFVLSGSVSATRTTEDQIARLASSWTTRIVAISVLSIRAPADWPAWWETIVTTAAPAFLATLDFTAPSPSAPPNATTMELVLVPIIAAASGEKWARIASWTVDAEGMELVMPIRLASVMQDTSSIPPLRNASSNVTDRPALSAMAPICSPVLAVHQEHAITASVPVGQDSQEITVPYRSMSHT